MSGFWNLIGRTAKYKTNVVLAIVFNILLSVFTVISIPLIIPFFQLLFDRDVTVQGAESDYITSLFTELIQVQGKEPALLIVCGLIIAVFFLKNLFRYLGTYVMAPLRTGMVYDIRKELYTKYLQLPLSVINGERSGDFISRISADVQEVEQSILKIIQVVFKAPLIIIGSIAYMLYLSPQLSLFVLGLLFFTVFIIGGVSRSLKRKSQVAQERLSNIVSQVEETISGQRIVKAFNAESYMQGRFDTENKGYRDVITRLIRRQELSSPLSEFLGVTIVAVLMYYGSQLVFKQALLTFSYTDGHPVLRHIDMTVYKGQTVALVGPSGSGKSTLADLILGYYPVSAGMISFDGVDIRDISLPSLRSMVALVSQHAVLFNDTVSGNIAFGRTGVTSEQIIAAAKMAHAHEFISALPKGYDTNVGDRGVLLSGGQRQRLTIARAILTDPVLAV